MADIVSNTPLVLVFEHKFCRSLLEGSSRPDAVHLCLAGLFHHSREISFGFLGCEPACKFDPCLGVIGVEF